MTSSRLPGKVMLPLAGQPMIVRVVERVARAEGVDAVCVAVPEGQLHRPVVTAVADIAGVEVVTGPEQDVLARTVLAARQTEATTIVRVTSDCPFADPEVVSSVVGIRAAANVVYARTAFDRGYPLGFDTEAIAMDSLVAAAAEAVEPYEREHVTPFIWRQPERFPAVYVDRLPDLRWWRLVVDCQEDYLLAREVYDTLGADFGLVELEGLFRDRPELLDLNADVAQTPYVGVPIRATG